MTEDDLPYETEGDLEDSLEIPDYEKQIDHFLQTYLFGNLIVREIRQSDGALNLLLRKSQEEALESAKFLLSEHLDLYTTDGVKTAQQKWAEFRRFADMARWLGEAVEEAGAAADALQQEADNDDDEQLRREMSGEGTQEPSD